MNSRPSQAGFSLIELIVVVILLGLLAAGGGLLVLRPIEAYDDIVRRQQLVDQGELALRQIARDVRRALPNSIRIARVGARFALELVTTVDGAKPAPTGAIRMLLGRARRTSRAICRSASSP